MAEVHILGTLEGASEFPQSTLCCKYSVVAGEGWSLLEGYSTGQTQVDIPLDPSQTIWNHPIDLHYNTKSIAGWPKFIVRVYHQDTFGRNILYGYGFAHVPATPGIHKVDIVTWRPCGNAQDQLWATFLGATVQLKDENLIYEPVDRFRLVTESMGKVHLKLMIVLRNFKKSGVSL